MPNRTYFSLVDIDWKVATDWSNMRIWKTSGARGVNPIKHTQLYLMLQIRHCAKQNVSVKAKNGWIGSYCVWFLCPRSYLDLFMRVGSVIIRSDHMALLLSRFKRSCAVLQLCMLSTHLDTQRSTLARVMYYSWWCFCFWYRFRFFSLPLLAICLGLYGYIMGNLKRCTH